MRTTRFNKVIQLLANTYGVEEVLDWYEMPEFVDVTARIGRDVSTYRVYNNGQITLKE